MILETVKNKISYLTLEYFRLKSVGWWKWYWFQWAVCMEQLCRQNTWLCWQCCSWSWLAVWPSLLNCPSGNTLRQPFTVFKTHLISSIKLLIWLSYWYELLWDCIQILIIYSKGNIELIFFIVFFIWYYYAKLYICYNVCILDRIVRSFSHKIVIMKNLTYVWERKSMMIILERMISKYIPQEYCQHHCLFFIFQLIVFKTHIPNTHAIYFMNV